MRDRLIAFGIVVAVLTVSALTMTSAECSSWPKIGSKIIIQGC